MLSRFVRPNLKVVAPFVRFSLGSTCWLAVSVLSLGCDNAGPRPSCASNEIEVDGDCVVPSSIAVNTVGFTPGSLKLASFADDGELIVRDEEGDVVHRGEGVLLASPDTQEMLRVEDFSSIEEPGTYTLEVSGTDAMLKVRIADDVYDEALEAMMFALYGQRCGEKVEFEYRGVTFTHGECHAEDGRLDHAEQEDTGTKDGTGGWHDAGDYGKYTVNGAFAAAILLMAYEHFEAELEGRAFEIPEKGGDLPDVLDELKVQLEWLLKMQFDDGQASHKLTTLNFTPNQTLAELAPSTRYFTAPSTAATADLAAVLAQAARIYEPFDEDFAATCLAAAKRGVDYLAENPDNFGSPTPQCQSSTPPGELCFNTGSYGGNDDDAARLWAAVEYWETTGDAEVLAAIEDQIPDTDPLFNFDWSNTTNLALFTYVLSEREERDPAIVEDLAARIVSQADDLARGAEEHAYGRALRNYYWGSNGVVARTTMNLTVADRLAPDDRYKNAMVQQVDHLLGRNYYKRSYVTGIGQAPPQAPHHRPSIADGNLAPWPGFLIGGPQPSAFDWKDISSDYQTNEVAINWTTTMIYAVLAVL